VESPCHGEITMPTSRQAIRRAGSAGAHCHLDLRQAAGENRKIHGIRWKIIQHRDGENGKFMENPWENVGKHLGNGANILETYEKNVGKYWKNVGKMCKTSWTFLCKHTGKTKTRKIWNVSGRFEHFLFFTAMGVSRVCLKNRGQKNVTIDQNLPLQNCHKLRDPTNFEITPN